MWAKDLKFGKMGSGRRLRRAEHRETLGDGRLLLPVAHLAVRFGPKDKEQVSVCTEIKLPAASSFLQTALPRWSRGLCSEKRTRTPDGSAAGRGHSTELEEGFCALKGVPACPRPLPASCDWREAGWRSLWEVKCQGQTCSRWRWAAPKPAKAGAVHSPKPLCSQAAVSFWLPLLLCILK